MSHVYLIGAGPGDPELLTIKALRAIESSDAILYDQLINPEILRHAKPQAELVFVGKSKGDHTLPQNEINELLVEFAAKYPTVSRLKGGDPLLFGRGGEEYEHLVKLGIPCHVIPGITSAMAASASFALPLTHRDYASSVTFITGHKKAGDDCSSFRNLALQGKTHVIYMGLSSLASIMEELGRRAENRKIPVAIVEKASRQTERILYGTVDDIAEQAKVHDIQSPALIIIGEVVNFSQRMSGLLRMNKNP